MSWMLALLLTTGQAVLDEVEQWRALLKDGKDVEAIAAVEERVKAGDPEALDFLGWFYDTGRGLPHDPAKAAQFYRRAAEAGQKHAQWRYGVMLDKGEGVAPDPVAAMAWFDKSAAQGFRNAMVSIGVMYSTGHGVPQDHAKALEAYKRAVRARAVAAFNHIGVIYLKGEGVAPDPVEAAAWFMIGAGYDDESAKQNLALAAEQLDEAQLRKSAERATAISKEYAL
jgi:TPR repeat protein